MRILSTMITLAVVAGAGAAGFYFRDDIERAIGAPERAAAPNAAVSAAPTARQAAPINNAWRVSCADDLANNRVQCAMSQTVIARETGQPILSVTFDKHSDSALPEMVAKLPNGFALTRGVQVEIDDEVIDTLAVRTCDGFGCFVAMPVTEPTLERLARGGRMLFRFQDLQSQPVVLASDLRGFAQAYAQAQGG